MFAHRTPNDPQTTFPPHPARSNPEIKSINQVSNVSKLNFAIPLTLNRRSIRSPGHNINMPNTTESAVFPTGTWSPICNYKVDDDADVVMTCDESPCSTAFSLGPGWERRRKSVSFPSPGSLLDTPLRTNLSPQDYTNPRIEKVSYLYEYPKAKKAEKLMRALALVLKPIMDENEWTVDHMTEYFGDMHIRGSNYNHGEIIFVRLRDRDDRNSFYKWKYILIAAIHELCHNMYSAHGGDFADLWDRCCTQLRVPFVLSEWLADSKPTLAPRNYVTLVPAGMKVFMSEADFQKHFSVWAQQGRKRPIQFP